MKKYSVLSCIFGDYEQIREVSKPDLNCEYILITDKDYDSFTWQVKNISNNDLYINAPDDYYRSYYVKTHPFEFVNTDKALWVDHSINILNGMQIQKYFIDLLDTKDFVEVLNLINPSSIRDEIDRWKHFKCRGINDDSLVAYNDYINMHSENLNNGMVQTTIYACKNTELVNIVNNETWELMLDFNKVSPHYLLMTSKSITLNKYYWNSPDLAIYYANIFFSSVFEYCYHNTNYSQSIGYYKEEDFPFYKGFKQNFNGYFQDQCITPLELPEKTHTEIDIVAIAKFEADYIEDWVKHHLQIGFDHIYIWDNNDINSQENYAEQLKDYQQVTVLNARGKTAYQRQSYLDFYNNFNFDWVLIIDIDEFLWFDHTYNDIHTFIKNGPDDAKEYIFQWKLYKGSKKDLSKHIYEVNTEEIPKNAKKFGWACYYTSWYKSIVKKGALRKIDQITEHYIYGDDVEKHSYDANFTQITNDMTTCFTFHDLSNAVVHIKHYPIRDLDTFYYKKLKRGHAGIDNTTNLIHDIYSKTDSLVNKFNWYQNWAYYIAHQGYLSEDDQKFLYKRGYQVNIEFLPELHTNFFLDFNSNNIESYTIMMHKTFEEYNLNMLNCLMCDKNTDKSITQNWLQKYATNLVGMSTYYDAMYGLLYNRVPLQYDKRYPKPLLYMNIENVDHYLTDGSNNDEAIFNLLLSDNFNAVLSDIIEKEMQYPDLNFIVSLKDLAYVDPQESLYKDINDNTRAKYNIPNNYTLLLHNNFYITTINIYNRVQEKFTKILSENSWYMLHDSIIESHNNNNYCLYDALGYIYYDLFDKIFLI